MGKNKYENFVFSIMICFLMVLGMTIYNTFLHSSGHVDVIGSLASVKFVMIFAVAFVIDWFFVAPLVKKIVAKLTNETTPFIKKVLLISGLMVLFMCTAMSLIATVVQGYEGSLLAAYAKVFALNIIVALPLQFVVVGPIARAAFFKLFPPAEMVAAN
ncbi:hypothetical protein ACOMICROBIO_FLGHMIGD_03823 [Vibrio sp. B1FLJ16]|uniref:DUF2798 domain-containing protein n=1 Tax=Vibrio sp. B1FLJ16 TaxID=2751178 RepID=UPI0015F53E14|nr:DUF2798 domain-containing protein [Vibrio sp. B1FLJ16]CAD7819055.1 hypothetical protein ACOMICROBIO_FLGHMIGD_03823 [Vibrio sp. B1FLJ16]CAE6937200.1 hypothetical protein ACOMICROBIO_FLGHMIGD_03823 [Vibrio sp. B1FLJ16]